jgi:hypothetical protein
VGEEQRLIVFVLGSDHNAAVGCTVAVRDHVTEAIPLACPHRTFRLRAPHGIRRTLLRVVSRVRITTAAGVLTAVSVAAVFALLLPVLPFALAFALALPFRLPTFRRAMRVVVIVIVWILVHVLRLANHWFPQ